MAQKRKQAPRLVADAKRRVTEQGLRFRLHDVKALDIELKYKPLAECLSSLANEELEFCASDSLLESKMTTEECVPVNYNGLIAAVYKAYSEHRSVSFSPDQIWLTILQGFAQHIHLNSETYRDQLVNHEGVKNLSVGVIPEADGSINWTLAFSGLCDSLSGLNSEATKSWVLQEFSTTKAIDSFSFQVALLEIMQPYHDYELMCICGIREIEILGTENDWQKIRDKIETLNDFGLDWWLPSLRLILDRFISVFQDRLQLEEWNDIMCTQQVYGGDLLDGWILGLVPYLRNHLTKQISGKNPIVQSSLESTREAENGQAIESPSNKGLVSRLMSVFSPKPQVSKTPGINPSAIPVGTSQFSFVLNNGEDSRSMFAIAGFAGITCSADDTLSAKLAWGVGENDSVQAAINHLKKHKLHRKAVKFESAMSFPFGVPKSVFQLYSQMNGAVLKNREREVIGELFSVSQLGAVSFDGQSFAVLGEMDRSYEAELEKERNDEAPGLSYAISDHPELGLVAWIILGRLGERFFAISQSQSTQKSGPCVFLFNKQELIEAQKFEKIEMNIGDFLIRELVGRKALD